MPTRPHPIPTRRLADARPHPGKLLVAAAILLAACTAQDSTPADEATPPAETPEEEAAATEAPDAGEGPDGAEDRPLERRRASDLPVPRTEVAGTVWDERIVVVGGLDAQGEVVANVDVYDADTGEWSAGPELPVALHHTAFATLDDRLYVVGGYTNEGDAWVPQDDVWSIGPGEDEWREEPPLATARGALAVASTGDRLVAIGGVDAEEQVLSSTEVFDGEAWASGPEMSTAREHLAATAVGDEVYAIAGRAGGLETNLASVEVLRGDAWEPAGELNFARGGIDAATLSGTPCVAGGEEPAGTIGSVECLTDDDWKVFAQLTVPRHGLAVVNLERVLHAIGGGPEPGLTVSDVHEVIPVYVSRHAT